MNVLTLRHGKARYDFEYDATTATVQHLKDYATRATKVAHDKQKILGLKKHTHNQTLLATLVADKASLMLVGSPDDVIAPARAAALKGRKRAAADVPDHLSIDAEALTGAAAPSARPENHDKISKRIASYSPVALNPARPCKKLLVLDIDYTLFDHRSAAERPAELARPFLHEFLERAYCAYDLAIWSATSMRWVQLKLDELGVSGSPRFKLMALFCAGAMITIETQKYGVLDVKPLAVIWGLYPQYGAHNTIMLDDLSRNFLMNPQSGLRVRPCRHMTVPEERDKDRELLRVGRYLSLLVGVGDMRTLNHKRWEAYVNKRWPRRREGTESGEVDGGSTGGDAEPGASDDPL